VRATPRHVLLLDEGFMSGAFTAVGLRDAGCRVTIAAGVGGRGGYDARDLSWSLAPPPESSAYVPFVDALVRRNAFDSIVPLTEPIQSLLWRAAPSWSDRIEPSVLPWQRALLADKRCMSELAGDRGVDVPRHVSLNDVTTIPMAVESLGLPMIVKGVVGRGGAATRIVGSVSEAGQAVASLRTRGVDCFAQEFVSGPTFLVGGVFCRGESVRIYAGEKLTQHPPRVGPAAIIRSVHDEQLLMAARSVVGALQWHGIASLDFIRDREGRYQFLELNPRPWGSIIAAEMAGVDLWSPLAELLGDGEPAASLAYAADVDCAVLPLALLSPENWRSPATLARLVGTSSGFHRRVWVPAGQGMHLIHRLARMTRRWRACLA
jgi:hypothetical protein